MRECKEIHNNGQQLEDLILKTYVILLNNKTYTYFHSETGTFTSICLTLGSPSVFISLFFWKVGSDPYGRDHFPIILEKAVPPSRERVQKRKLGDQISEGYYRLEAILCSSSKIH